MDHAKSRQHLPEVKTIHQGMRHEALLLGEIRDVTGDRHLPHPPEPYLIQFHAAQFEIWWRELDRLLRALINQVQSSQRVCQVLILKNMYRGRCHRLRWLRHRNRMQNSLA